MSASVASNGKKAVKFKPSDIKEYLGPQKVFSEVARRTSQPGVATGLAWTQTGGDILFVEAVVMPGKRQLILTGHLGNVMQESAKAGLSCLRTIAKDLNIDPDFVEKYDIHLHVPAGAIPKDGPSAGITMATAMASALMGRAISKDIAMTGEITISGMVLPVGGIKEKVLAAKRAGIKKIILPSRNRQDVEEIEKNLRKGLEFIYADMISDVIETALKPRRSALRKKSVKKKNLKKKVSRHKTLSKTSR